VEYYNKNIYFETSAVNFVLKNMAVIDAIATRSLQTAKGNKWYISPITLWEMMLISDQQPRENLLNLSKYTFHKYLLKSPSEILIGYLNDEFKISNPLLIQSNSHMAQVWKNICENPFLQFEFVQGDFQKASSRFKTYSKNADQIINAIYFDLEVKGEIKHLNILIDLAFKSIYKEKQIDREQSKILKINLLFILVILCIGIDITPEVIQAFWKTKPVSGFYQRLEYIISAYPKLMEKGPLLYGSFMAYSQMKFKKSRGMFHDALHCLYLPLVDVFFTNDSDFKEFKLMNLNSNVKKIFHLDDVEFTTKQTWVDYEPLL
jgi:hypothetical protein